MKTECQLNAAADYDEYCCVARWYRDVAGDVLNKRTASDPHADGNKQS